jgi:UDP-glucose 4-epimerase
MRVLITGGAGFVGSNLVGHLSTAGHDVVAVDDLSAGARPEWWGSRSGPARSIEASIEDGAAMRRAMKGVDAVVHLAARPGVQDSVDHPELDFQTNVLGTFNLMDAARRVGVSHMVFASSGAVLAGAEPPLSEDMPPRPMSPYGASKLYGEGITAAAGAFGIVGVSLRFANVYGPLCAHKKSVVAAFLKQGLRRKPFVVYGSGKQTRDFLYVEDVCRAVERALGAKRAGIYHLGTGVETSVVALAEQVAQVCDVPLEFDRRPPRPADPARNFVSYQAARRALKWTPKVGLPDGLRRTADWLRSQRRSRG